MGRATRIRWRGIQRDMRQAVTADPARLWDTRLQLHWAAQAAAGVGRTIAPPQSDFSHESFVWSDEHRALIGHRAGIRLRDMSLLVFDENAVASELPMNGRTLSDGFAFFERHFGLESMKPPPQGMPDHPAAHGATFDADLDSLAHLESCYAEAARALDDVRRRERGAGPVRCWPHHFDIATLIAISGHGEEAKTIGVGMVPGDESDHEPYYYVTPWPYPRGSMLPPLAHGHWHTNGWVGARLRLRDEAPLEEFLADAIRHCRALL